MNFKELLQPILQLALPYIKEFIDSVVVPKIIRKSYEKFDDYSNKMIEKLSDLVEKIHNTDDEAKRKRHLEGFEIGLKTLRAIAEKLIKACDILDNEIWDYNNETTLTTEDLISDEEIPF